MAEFFGTSSAEPCGLAWKAPTIAMSSPPAAAKTGGALPTLPMSTAPPAIAWSMGGPEVKSDQVALNGSLLISPAAVSSACAPEPAWSPICRVTLETSVVPALAVPPVLAVPPDAVLPLDEEQPAATRASRAMLAASGSARRRPARAARRGARWCRAVFVVVISFPPRQRPAR